MANRLSNYRAVTLTIMLISLFAMSCSSSGDSLLSFETIWNGRTETPKAKKTCPEPRYCQCNWKKQSVSCGNNMTYIPDLPANTRNLSMDGAYLENINRGTFANLTNARLEYLGLTHCGLQTVSEDAFKDVVFYKNGVLSLSGNVISLDDLHDIICNLSLVNISELRLDQMPSLAPGLPSGYFECLCNTSVTRLSLMENQLETFSGNVFDSKSKLRSLQLDYNSIHAIEMMNMNSLDYLGLRWNRLVKLPQFADAKGKSLCPKLHTLAFAQNSGPENLKSIDFKGLTSLVDLQLRSNNIRALQDNFLSEMPKLQRVALPNNVIRQISKEAFKSQTLLAIDFRSNALRFHLLKSFEIFQGCPALKTLYLTDNTLKGLAKDQFVKLFSPLKKLENLYIDNTRLEKIPFRLFENLPSLQNAFLSKNRISQWNSSAFVGARRLRKLYLDNNAITLVNETSFPRDFFTHIEKLYLGLNPFSCTCDLLWFRNWLNQTNITIVGLQFPYAYKCHYPKNLRNKPLLEFRPTLKECTSVNIYIVVGVSLAGLVVIVTVIVVVVIRHKMHIRYFFFLLRSRMKQYTKLDDVNDYCYDAFVAYSAEDRDWVLQKLLPRVEYQEGYKLCIYDRDFVPGRDIVDNIIEHLELSRMVIIVLSDSFAKSEWCKWELTMAQNKLLDERKDILVLVKLDEIRPEHLNNRLMLLMRDKVYIDWSDCTLGQDMFWHRLLDSLARPAVPIP